MTELLDRLQRLSPAKQRLLQRRLRQRSSASEVETIGPSPLREITRGTTDRFPCSFAQQRLWFLHQLEPLSPAYNIPLPLRLVGPLDPAALEHALSEVFERHEALRTTFEEGEQGPLQVVVPDFTLWMPLIDLSGLAETVQEGELGRLVKEDARRPFDLQRLPLLRPALVRRAPEDHALLLTIHHIVADGWSGDVLVREVIELYRAALERREPVLPELPIQYADFADWQRNWLQGPVLEAQVSHWRQVLQGAPPLLDLPTDRPRPAVQSPRGAYLAFQLPEPLAAAIDELGRRQGTTPFAPLVTALHILLARISRQADVSTGFPVSGRRHYETENLIGFFVNTLMMRSDLSDDPPFREALRRAQVAFLDAQTHQDLPFEKLVDELKIERSLAWTPLFQVMFAMRSDSGEAPPTGGLQVSGLSSNTASSKFDLSVTVTTGAPVWTGVFEYSTDLFDAATIARFSRQFRRILEGAAADPSLPVSRLPLLTSEERSEILALGEVRDRYSVTQTLHGIFQDRAKAAPDAVAVVSGEESLTYRELRDRAGELAHRLRALGVGPEARVGLCVERSVEMVVGILGVLEAGGAYVPIDPAYPEERIKLLIEDSGIAALLTQKALRDRLPTVDVQVIEILRSAQDDTGGGGRGLPLPRSGGGPGRGSIATPDNLAYVIYTSGSTGRPKGVGVTHANAVRLFSAAAPHFDFSRRDVWTLFHSHAFDFSVWEIWGALLTGGRLVVVPYLVSRSPAAFLDLLRREGVTVLSQTPSAFRSLIEAEEDSPGSLSLRYVVFGGEALDLQALRPWMARHGDRRPLLINMYGITETTVHVTWRPVTTDDLERGASSPIGEPLPDLALHLLDAHLEPVPLGVAGEICVGGAGLARGYLGRPELTAERFVPDPHAQEPGSRLYRSGDLARRLPRTLADTEIEYLGRIDHQVKVRGFRIELGEIEAALAEHPDVRQALVLARSDDGEKRLVAYVIPAAEASLRIEDLRAFLLSRLPEHMVPAAFVTLAALPLTPHGKVDRAALPTPDRERPELASGFMPPRNNRELVLAEIWAEVLGLDQVGVRDNFFALGGDSILSIRVRSRAAQRGLLFDLQELFRHQTIAELAEAVQEAREERAASEPFALVSAADRKRLPEEVEDAYPLSFLQLGMLFHSAKEETASPYHNVSSYTLRAPFDGDALRQAIEVLTSRHPVLRTAFALAGYEVPLQLVHRSVPIPLDLDDLRPLTEEERQAVLAERFESERRRRFDLKEAPLIRFWVYRLTDNTFEVGVAEHHAILDGWSYASLLAELFEVYFSLLDSRDLPPSAPLQSAFRDYVALEQEALTNGEAGRFWIDRLAGATLLKIPRWKRPAVPETAERIRKVHVPVSPVAVEALEGLANAAQASFKSVLLAAHLRFLALVGASRDVLTGLVTNGRPETEEGERALGLFLNSVPFRLRLADVPWIDLVRAAFTAELEILPHRRYPLARIQQDLGGQPLFEVAFNYVHFHVLGGIARPDLELLSARTFAETSFPLAVHCTRAVGSAGADISLQYDQTQLDAAQVQTFAEVFARILDEMVADPGSRCFGAPLLSEASRHQVLVEWNDTRSGFADGPCLHDLFEEHARQSPETPAVVFGDHSITYGELARRSRLLAQRLRERGVGPESLVGIYAGEGIGRILGVLAVYQAGGAYLPLDPSYPAERLAWMVEDAGLRIVLTDGASRPSLPAGEVEALLLDPYAPSPALPRFAGEGESAPLGDELNDVPLARATPQNLAYVIYTSGSTGRPNGVQVEHGSAVRAVLQAIRLLEITPGSRVLDNISFSFDPSVLEIWMTLASGSTLYAVPREARGSGPLLAEIIRRERVTHCIMIPAVLSLVPVPQEENPLVGMILGGESLSAELANRWAPPASPIRHVLNSYGPTEATIYVSYQRLQGPYHREPSIGRPIEDTRLRVLGPDLEPLPAGVPGELWIAGVALARGYLRRRDVTAAKFIPDPFSAEPGGRLYRTGDLARWAPDGTIEFLGRVDDQVKIRGQRVELGEIVARLVAHPGIREAVVLADGEGTAKRLTAFVVPGAAGEVQEGELRDRLRETLPEPMVPSRFLFLDALPLTTNGKVDRRALLQMEAREVARRDRVEPRDAIELDLVRIWREALKVPDLGVRDDFFEHGGNSLIAVSLLAQVEKSFGRALPASALLRGSTVESLATLLRAGGTQSTSPLVTLQAEGAHPPFFCVHGVGGEAIPFASLARHLGQDHPFHGFQAPGLTGEAEPLDRVEALADLYLEELRRAHPEGPYLLGGWSMGGAVAFEMARRLSQEGREPVRLILLDTSLPSRRPAGALPEEQDLLVGIQDYVRAHWGRDLPLSRADLEGLAPRERLERALAALVEAGLLPPGAEPEHLQRHLAVYRANANAYLSYEPGFFPGRILLLQAAEASRQEERSWSDHASEVEVRTVPGDHFSMLAEPHVGKLAEILLEVFAIDRRLPAGVETPAYRGVAPDGAR